MRRGLSQTCEARRMLRPSRDARADTTGRTTFTPGRQPAERSHPLYDDTSIEGLQRRRVLFLACHQSTHALSSAASTSGRNPDQKSVDEIVAEFRQHYLPGIIETPAGVGELVRLQNKGYRLVVNH